MTTATLPLSLRSAFPAVDRRALAPLFATALAFAIVFAQPMAKLARDWWIEPDAGHGLLLAPLAVYLAWKRGIVPNATGQRALGFAILVVSMLLRYGGGLASELFTIRASLIGTILGLIIFWLGLRQIRHSWLAVSLMILAVPLPVVVLSSIAFPLQLQASRMGAALLEWRHIPVLLQGNVIHLPGRTLFVTEACSGLRSLAALLSLGVLIGGLWLRYPVSRLFLVLMALPVAMLLNGIRVFLTGFLVYFVDPKLGEGFMHLTEGWIIFVVAFGFLGCIAWALQQSERLVARRAA